MNKGLEALKRFRDDIEIGYLHIDNVKDKQNYLGLLDIIETELKRQDSIEITAIDIEQDNKELCKENKTLKQALEIIKKYTYSGGWSGDYTTRYWDMKNSEIKVIEKVFKNVPIHALSDGKKIY